MNKKKHRVSPTNFTYFNHVFKVSSRLKMKIKKNHTISQKGS